MTDPEPSTKEASDGRWWWIWSVTIIAAVTATVLLYVVQGNYTVMGKNASPVALTHSEREQAHLLEHLLWRAKWDRAVASGELKLSTRVGFGMGMGKDSQQLCTIYDAQRRDLPRIVEWFRRNYQSGTAPIHLTVLVALPVREIDSLGTDGKPANMFRSRTYKIDANGAQYTGNVSEGWNAKVSQAIDSGVLDILGDPVIGDLGVGSDLTVTFAHDSDVLIIAEWMSKQMAEADPAIRVHFLQDEKQQFKISAGKVKKE